VLANSSEPGLIDTVTYIGITEERPDWRGTLTTTYETGRFGSLARISYFGKFSSAQPGYCDMCRERYGSKTLVDLEVAYRFNQTRIALGARNLFDVYPDQPSSNRPTDPATRIPIRPSCTTTTTAPSLGGGEPVRYNGRSLYTRVEMTLDW